VALRLIFVEANLQGSDLIKSRCERAVRLQGEILCVCLDPFVSKMRNAVQRARKISSLGQSELFNRIRPGAIRRWRLHHSTQTRLEELAQKHNPNIQGWINYLGHFYGSRLSRALLRIDAFLTLWARRKFRRLRRRPRSARAWLRHLRREQPNLFAHWRFVDITGRTSGAVFVSRVPSVKTAARNCVRDEG
jgi:hypothetical protein